MGKHVTGREIDPGQQRQPDDLEYHRAGQPALQQAQLLAHPKPEAVVVGVKPSRAVPDRQARCMEKEDNERKPSRNPDHFEKESRHLAMRNKPAAGLCRRPSELRALLYQIPYPLEIMSG